MDDILRAGSKKLREISRLTYERFDMDEDKTPPCTSTGFNLLREDDETLRISQNEYCEKIKPMPEDGTFADFASLRMKLAWLSHSRPDVLYAVSQLA